MYSVSGIGPNFQIIQKACLASSDYFVLLSKYRKQSKINNGYIPSKEDFKGKIEFKNVKFIYPHDKTKKVVLDDLNLVIEPGKKIALIGESGCGKSTTINLIEKFYEANAGQILIDGKDIKEYDIENLRDLMGYVQQEPVLFNTSIKDNIVFGRERKLLKLGSIDQMVKESCDEAYIRKFIEKNEDKYDYIVGIKGGKLSAGQKQRIAIARAILMKPKILILDEATSSLDNKSEKEVQKALDNICKKEITIFIISHRLSTIKNSDLIYVMKDGKIIEKGKHKELLEKNGYYFGLIREQLTADEISQLNEKNDIKKLNTSSSLIYDNFDLDDDFNENESLPLNQDLSKNEEKQKIKISLRRLYNLISDHKCSLFLGILSGLVYGSISPIVGVFLGKTVNSFSSLDLNKVEEDSIKFVIFYISVSIIGGLSIFLKMWKMQSLGLIMSIKIKKKFLKNALNFK
jgi:ABC-type multidrug transport system fused ATPase/permease subunit